MKIGKNVDGSIDRSSDRQHLHSLCHSKTQHETKNDPGPSFGGNFDWAKTRFTDFYRVQRFLPIAAF